jgi:protein-S-isoprenylcysteine O-methyltransferase Ste14
MEHNQRRTVLFHLVIRAGFACAWGVLILVWAIGWFTTKARTRRASYASRLVIILPILIFYVLIGAHILPRSWVVAHLWPQTPDFEAVGLLLTILGCAFAIWARMTLGTNWSSMPDVKQSHELITKGPYALVRHPIYSGLLLALAGTVVAAGVSSYVLVWALLAISYALKFRQEERLMMETFPDAYPEYRKRVKAIIPGIL